MGALEEVLPIEIKRSAVLSGQELVLPFSDARRAVEIATHHLIAVLGIECFRIQHDGLGVMDYSGYAFGLTGDWQEFVHSNNTEAVRLLDEHDLGDGHGYILTSTSQKEYRELS